jgi:hypothetical protein
MFANAIQKGKEEQKLPSLPSDLRRELFALPGPEIASAAKKGDMTLMMDDISRIMRGSLPQYMGIESPSRKFASGDTQWGRDNASDFDKTFKIYKRIRGDKDSIDWNNSIKNGKPIGEGQYGAVLKVGNMAIKRGEVGGEEANIIKKVGEAGIGPKLHGAEISTKLRKGEGIDLHKGRIAMSIVPGKPLGDVDPDQKVAGKNAVDIYWKSMADLHRLGIAHNDAHPYNLMVDNKGNGRWVDFGYSQQNPKAALAEALGSFSRSTKERDGNWQAIDWKVSGLGKYNEAKRVGGFAEIRQRNPIFGKVMNNMTGVEQELMRKHGLTRKEVDQMMDHGIRSELSSYTKGPWGKITDSQAQNLLNTLYDGV